MIEFSGSYQQYESYEIYLLFPEGMVVTCDMIRCFLKAAYLDMGICNVLEM